MVLMQFSLSDKHNRFLNIVKARNGFVSKSEALNFVLDSAMRLDGDF